MTRRSPPLRADPVAPRAVQRNIARALADGRIRGLSHPRRAACATVTISITATPIIDALVQDLVHELNLSRSAVIRQAIMHYHSEVVR